MAPTGSRHHFRALLTLALLPACGDTPFSSTATYAAPSSGLTRWIGTQGTVSPAALT